MRTILILSLILLTGCASTWDKQRQQIKSSYKRGKISKESYSLMLRNVDKNESVFLQQSQENKITQQQTKQKLEEGYYIPPEKVDSPSNKRKNCSTKCDCFGNCETVCE